MVEVLYSICMCAAYSIVMRQHHPGETLCKHVARKITCGIPRLLGVLSGMCRVHEQ